MLGCSVYIGNTLQSYSCGLATALTDRNVASGWCNFLTLVCHNDCLNGGNEGGSKGGGGGGVSQPGKAFS